MFRLLRGESKSAPNWFRERVIRRRVAEIEQSGLFNLTFYRQQSGDFELNLDQAIRHYLKLGWAKEFSPSQDFDTPFYLRMYPDIQESAQNPLSHYIKYGREEGRFSKEPDSSGVDRTVLKNLPDLSVLAKWRPTSLECIIVHIYYADMWPVIQNFLQELPESFDLIVTLVVGKSDHLKNEIERTFPGSFCPLFPNHGRDIFPFIAILNTRVFQKYEYVCKIHTKKSPHLKNGAKVSKYLLTQLVGQRFYKKIRRLLDSDEGIGIVAPQGYLLGKRFIGPNLEKMTHVGTRGNVDISPHEDIAFPSGSMFWFRPNSLEWLRTINLEGKDFDFENSQLDGTMAHAVERLFGISCVQGNLRLVEASPGFLGKLLRPLVVK
ncbi:MAG: hypothetical protein JKY20_02005 [Alphaproteobacteria bacterium]|nr:hypothetical protein [Alphaproteobacteria bacterium]